MDGGKGGKNLSLLMQQRYQQQQQSSTSTTGSGKGSNNDLTVQEQQVTGGTPPSSSAAGAASAASPGAVGIEGGNGASGSAPSHQQPIRTTQATSPEQQQAHQPVGVKPKGKDFAAMAKRHPVQQKQHQIGPASLASTNEPGTANLTSSTINIITTTTANNSGASTEAQQLQQINAARKAIGMPPLLERPTSSKQVIGVPNQLPKNDYQHQGPITSSSTSSTVALLPEKAISPIAPPVAPPKPTPTPKPTALEGYSLSSTPSNSHIKSSSQSPTNNKNKITSNHNPPMIGMKLSALLPSLEPSKLFEIDNDAQELLIALANDFANNLIKKSQRVAKYRHSRNGNTSKVVEVEDVSLILKKNYNITIPGLSLPHDRIKSKTKSTLDAMKILGSASNKDVNNDNNVIDNNQVVSSLNDVETSANPDSHTITDNNGKRKRMDGDDGIHPLKKMNISTTTA